MLDITTAREVVNERDIYNIGLVRFEGNLAEGRTKRISQAALRTTLETSSHVLHPVQWIIRHEYDNKIHTPQPTTARLSTTSDHSEF